MDRHAQTGLALRRFAGDADLLPFRAAGDAERQHAFRDNEVRSGAFPLPVQISRFRFFMEELRSRMV
jgi:hypothetical protein